MALPSSTARRPLLFLQLPCLDNDTQVGHENVPLAAALLAAAGETRPAATPEPMVPDPAFLALDDAHLVDAIREARPSVVAATVYLWNVERTLHILRAVRAAAPDIRFVVGGPETARTHPFLFRSRVPDAVVVGEGEPVFPGILTALANGGTTDWSTVAWRNGRGYAWGRRAPPPVNMACASGPMPAPARHMDSTGIGYLETSRGCPLRCAYCRYHHLRSRPSYRPPAAVGADVSAMLRAGARELRFIDPTLNAHPAFDDLLQAVAAANRAARAPLFAELRPDRITDKTAALLAEAGFREIEVGVQSRQADVLARIGRPLDVMRTEAGIRALAAAGIRTTVDLMYGLPGQTADHVRRDVDWGLALPAPATVQCMHTLLLPGTALRARAARLGIRARILPPYDVRATDTLSGEDLLRIEELLAAHPGLRQGGGTERFVGAALPGLFPEQVRVNLDHPPPAAGIPGQTSRRTVFLAGTEIFEQRATAARLVRDAVRRSPHTHWQFVLEPAAEEPLDLLEMLADELAAFPELPADRAPLARGRRSARRLLVRLPRGHSCSRAWIRAAEACLRERFY